MYFAMSQCFTRSRGLLQSSACVPSPWVIAQQRRRLKLIAEPLPSDPATTYTIDESLRLPFGNGPPKAHLVD